MQRKAEACTPVMASRFGKPVKKKPPVAEEVAREEPSVKTALDKGETPCGSLAAELSKAEADPQNCIVEVEHHTQTNYGKRHDNEDRVFFQTDVLPDSNLKFYTVGVLDGHDTEVASDFVSKRLPLEVAKLLKRGSPVAEAYTRAMKLVEEELRAVTLSAGTCALMCTIAGRCLWCANLGDCRAVLVPLAVPYPHASSKEKAAWKPKVLGITWMSEDHKASCPREELRIQAAGGKVTSGRVEGLEPSRTLGDFDVKAKVSKDVISIVPEVRRHEFVPDGPTPAQAVLVCACDGIWDVLTGNDICNLIVARKELCDLQADIAAQSPQPDRGVLKLLAEDLVQFSIAKGSQDDCTAIVTFISVPGASNVCETPSNAGGASEHVTLFGRSVH